MRDREVDRPRCPNSSSRNFAVWWSSHHPGRAGCMRSSSTAIACSCGSRTAKPGCVTRKGLDWTAKFSAIAKSAAILPDSIIDGEVCALDHNGAPDFAALQAALVGRQDRSR